jgi:hypothetical protein
LVEAMGGAPLSTPYYQERSQQLVHEYCSLGECNDTKGNV